MQKLLEKALQKGDDNLLAEIIVSVMFGYQSEQKTSPAGSEEPEDMDEKESFVLTTEHEDLPWIREVKKTDWEVERYAGLEYDEHGFPVATYDDGTSISDPWFTFSGNNPVVDSIADKADQHLSAGKSSVLKPDWIPEFYSQAWAYKKQEHNFHCWVRAIKKYSENQNQLEKLWKKFWKGYFERKAKGFDAVNTWLHFNHIRDIKQVFAWYRK